MLINYFKVALRIPGVSARLTDDGDDQPTDEYIPGTLAIVEKARNYLNFEFPPRILIVRNCSPVEISTGKQFVENLRREV